MTPEPKTIDNLGPQASIEYAKAQERYKRYHFIEDSRILPTRAAVFAKPYVLLSDFAKFYAIHKTIRWAFFVAPKGYYVINCAIFSYALIPSLGGYETLEANLDKIETLERTLEKANRTLSSEELKELKTLLHLLQCINILQKTLELINARRGQYQRG